MNDARRRARVGTPALPRIEDVRLSALILGRTYGKRVPRRGAPPVARRGGRTARSLPRRRCNFSFDSQPSDGVGFDAGTDSRALVSLASYDRTRPFLKPYANKLPLMCINVSRLEYTARAFGADGSSADPTDEALRFYVETDIGIASEKRFASLRTDSAPVSHSPADLSLTVDRIDDNTRRLVSEYTREAPSYDAALQEIALLSRTLSDGLPGRSGGFDARVPRRRVVPPNEAFSDLLHLLRSDGYEEYLFRLAERTGAHVDLIVDDGLVYRYGNLANPASPARTIAADGRSGRWNVSVFPAEREGEGCPTLAVPPRRSRRDPPPSRV